MTRRKPTLHDLAELVEDLAPIKPEEEEELLPTPAAMAEGLRKAMELIETYRRKAELEREARGEPEPLPTPPIPEPTRAECLARLRAMFGGEADEAVAYVERERVDDSTLGTLVGMLGSLEEPVVPRDTPRARLERAGVDIPANTRNFLLRGSPDPDIAKLAGPVDPLFEEVMRDGLQKLDAGFTREDLVEVIRGHAESSLAARRLVARNKGWEERPIDQLRWLADVLTDMHLGAEDAAILRRKREKEDKEK